jgi:hypothetical protein
MGLASGPWLITATFEDMIALVRAIGRIDGAPERDRSQGIAVTRPEKSWAHVATGADRKLRATRLIVPLLLVGIAAAGCSFAPSDLYSSVATNATKFNTGWDAALAPISCKSLHYEKPYWWVNGPLVVDGVDFSDSALTDPAAGEAIGRKFSNHVGPGC